MTMNLYKRIFTYVLSAVLLMGLLAACGATSSEPCTSCGRTPTKKYQNESSGEAEYYCEVCSSDCAFCSGKATQHYSSALGVIVFVCDSCYEEIQSLNS